MVIKLPTYKVLIKVPFIFSRISIPQLFFIFLHLNRFSVCPIKSFKDPHPQSLFFNIPFSLNECVLIRCVDKNINGHLSRRNSRWVWCDLHRKYSWYLELAPLLSCSLKFDMNFLFIFFAILIASCAFFESSLNGFSVRRTVSWEPWQHFIIGRMSRNPLSFSTD